jgi:copper chaperone CopZ
MKKLLMLSASIAMLSGAAYADTINATVNGLVCSFCATGIEKTFKAQAAVESVKVDLDHQLVSVKTKPDQNLDDATVTKLLTDSGYTVTDIKRQK